MIFECVFFQQKTNNTFWGLSVFLTKSDFLLDESKTHFTDEKLTIFFFC